jgi:hypothetical protein
MYILSKSIRNIFMILNLYINISMNNIFHMMHVYYSHLKLNWLCLDPYYLKSQIDQNIIKNLNLILAKIYFWKMIQSLMIRNLTRPEINMIKKNSIQPAPARDYLM